MPEGLTGQCPQSEDITHCGYFFQGLNPLYFLSNLIALQCLQTDFLKKYFVQNLSLLSVEWLVL